MSYTRKIEADVNYVSKQEDDLKNKVEPRASNHAFWSLFPKPETKQAKETHEQPKIPVYDYYKYNGSGD